jgi:hypothetical protein
MLDEYGIYTLRPCSVMPNQAWIDLDWVPHVTIHADEKSIPAFFSHSVKPGLYSTPKGRIFFSAPSHELEPQLRRSGKIRVRVMGEVAIYPCMKVLEFNPTKGLGERHGFTQSNGGLKP